MDNHAAKVSEIEGTHDASSALLSGAYRAPHDRGAEQVSSSTGLLSTRHSNPPGWDTPISNSQPSAAQREMEKQQKEPRHAIIEGGCFPTEYPTHPRPRAAERLPTNLRALTDPRNLDVSRFSPYAAPGEWRKQFLRLPIHPYQPGLDVPTLKSQNDSPPHGWEKPAPFRGRPTPQESPWADCDYSPSSSWEKQEHTSTSQPKDSPRRDQETKSRATEQKPDAPKSPESQNENVARQTEARRPQKQDLATQPAESIEQAQLDFLGKKSELAQGELLNMAQGVTRGIEKSGSFDGDDERSQIAATFTRAMLNNSLETITNEVNRQLRAKGSNYRIETIENSMKGIYVSKAGEPESSDANTSDYVQFTRSFDINLMNRTAKHPLVDRLKMSNSSKAYTPHGEKFADVAPGVRDSLPSWIQYQNSDRP